ncbi:hypothetical protein [Haloferax profundi]|uniref:Uncharacterized protein n=1 Tax=Haloferax profundi TaxID=1544718 RepID=A0A0W1SWW8_9EURY|nr:hypothetical protein [Haloferax profundi]KTG30988.1 hypothetical protein AUR66_00355 [Haloferax profundi]
MAADGFVFVLFFALAIGAPLVLYWAMQQETKNRPKMDRNEAERRAKAEGEKYNRRSADGRSRE